MCIVQNFESDVVGARRLRTQLRDSTVNVLRKGDLDGPLGAPLRVASQLLSPLLGITGGIGIGGAEAGAAGLGGVGDAQGTLARIVQPGAQAQPPKQQLLSYLDDEFRVVRDNNSFALYSRIVQD